MKKYKLREDRSYPAATFSQRFCRTHLTWQHVASVEGLLTEDMDRELWAFRRRFRDYLDLAYVPIEDQIKRIWR